MDELTKWAQNVQKKVYKEWEAKYSFYNLGFRVFDSKVRNEAPIMIISYQPGGKEKNFIMAKQQFAEENYALPDNIYLNKIGKMSNRVRDFFEFKDGNQLLEESVVFPLIFFRSRNVKTWRSVHDRKEMEKFCFPIVVEIIDRIKPQRILVIGVSTYKKLKKLSDEICEEEVVYCRTTKNGRKEKMAIKAKFKGYKIFATMHFAGARIKIEDWNKVKDMFQKWLDM